MLTELLKLHIDDPNLDRFYKLCKQFNQDPPHRRRD